MNSKFNKYFAFLTVLAVLLAQTALSFAQSQNEMQSFSLRYDPESFSSGFDDEAPAATTAAPQTETAETDDAAAPTVDPEVFLNRVKQELDLSKTDYHQLLNSISDAKARLQQVTEESLSLKEQLQNVDDQMVVAKNKLVSVIGQVVEKENEIILISEDIEEREIALNYQKELLRDYFRLIYQEEGEFLSVDKDGSVDAFKLLLMDGSVGENLRKIEYFELLNEAGQQMVMKLDEIFKELSVKRNDLNDKKEKFAVLQEQLTLEKDQLEMQKQAKEKLLQITLGQEEIYSQLLEQTQKEQEQLINDIKNLANAVNFIQGKILQEGPNFDPNKYLSLLDYKTQVLYNFQIENYGLTTDEFIWPVDPDRGISAYFRDPGYVGVFGVQHNAVDIPEYQGSPVRAVADGVVYTARDNGYGYNYIILAHAGGFMTIYGHVTTILVDEGQTVTQGSIIALSGGMPGTLGAGYMTTGPHLHFEVRLNGLYVDPLEYLPLETLTEDQMERLPEKYQDDWEEAVLDSLTGPVLRF